MTLRGAKMAYTTKREAVDAANSLRSRLHGKGWAKVVHENIGWHFSVYRHHAGWQVNLHESTHAGRTLYWALVGSGAYPFAGEIGFYPAIRSADPNKVVRAVAKHLKLKAIEEQERMSSAIAFAEDLLCK
jgi:hypothetical protein